MGLDATTALSLARDAFSASTSYFDSSIRKEVEADLRRFQGLHPAGSKYLSEAYRAKSRLFRPKTRTMLTKHEARAAEAFFANRDVVSIEPQDDSDAMQKASAALHKELMQYRLTKTIPWFLTVMGAYQDAMTVGLVCSYQHWVYNKKKGKDEPAIDLIPLENVRFDPGASWLNPVNTSPYFIQLIPMYVKDVKARMANDDEKTGEKKWKKLDDGAILAAMKGYSDSIRVQREQGRMDSKENSIAVSNYALVWVHKNIVEHDGEDYCYYTLADQQLLSDPVLLKKNYHHGRRPYVIGYCSLETHKNYPGGPNRKGKDVQAEINENANARIDNVKLAMNKRYLVGRNRQVDIRSLTRGTAGGATLVNDVEKDVRELEFNDVTASAYKEQEVLNLDFDEATGNFSSASVQANRTQNETLGGMELVEDDAGQVANYQLRTFVETWVEPVLQQLILLEQMYESDEVILALAGKKAKVDDLGFDYVTDELMEQELLLTVNVGMGPTSPEKKINRFLTALRAIKEAVMDGTLASYGLDFHEVCNEVFGALGYKDGSRFFKSEEDQDPRVAQLMQEMQKLQQALDSKFPPELIDAQVRHIDAQITALEPKNKLATAQAVKAGVETAFSAMQGAEVIAAVPAVASIADVIMQGAGYQLPSPAGVDPNFPTPAPGTPNTAAAAVAPQGGIPKVTSNEVSGGAPGDTTPNTPASPATPGTGERQGIETQESDSEGPGFRDGGLVGYRDEYGVDVATRKALASGSIVSQMLSAPISARFGAGNAQDNARAGFAEQDDAQRMRNERLIAAAAAPRPARPLGGPSVVGGMPPLYAGGPISQLAQSSMAQPQMLTDPLGTGTYGLDDNYASYANGGMVPGYAQGGLIQGPGTGTSDSIPAVTETGAPLSVSNQEYTIPPQVVQALGKDFFDQLIAQYHQPVQGQEPIYQADGPMDSPVGIQSGTIIIPADVVAALGADFFDELVKRYGGAQS